MTPEERLRLLRGSDQWTFTLKARADVAPTRAAWSPWVVSLATIATVAVVGVITFSVFGLGIRAVHPVAPPVLPTSSATAAPTPSATPSPTGTPTSSATPSVVSNRPDTRFQFTCSDLLSDTDASELMGSPVHEVDNITTALSAFWVIPYEANIAQVGGLACEWSNGVPQNSIGGSGSGYIGYQVFALPDAVAEWNAAQAKGLGDEYVGCSGDNCNSTVLAGSTWFQTFASNVADNGRTTGERLAAFQATQDAMNTVATTAAVPAPREASTASALPTSCDGYASDAQMSAAAGTPISTSTAGDSEGGGWSIEAEGVEQSGEKFCYWATGTGKYLISLHTLPGGAWVPNDYASVTAPQGASVAMTIPGLGSDDRAYLRCTAAASAKAPDNVCALDLAVGGNWVQLEIYPSQGGWSKNSVAPRDALTAVAKDIVANLK